MESRRATKFLYMSGYTGELIQDHGSTHGFPLLEKPFTHAVLLRTIEAVLM